MCAVHSLANSLNDCCLCFSFSAGKKSSSSHTLLIVIVIAAAVVITLGTVCVCCVYCRRKKSTKEQLNQLTTSNDVEMAKPGAADKDKI